MLTNLKITALQPITLTAYCIHLSPLLVLLDPDTWILCSKQTGKSVSRDLVHTFEVILIGVNKVRSLKTLVLAGALAML